MYRLSTTFWFSSSWCDVYLCLGDSDEQNIYNHIKEINLMVVNMLQNLSHRYFSHNSNIKCISLIIKCIDFESIHCTINLNVVSSFMVFSEFDFIFLSMYCSMNLFLFRKKKLLVKHWDLQQLLRK